MECSCFWLRANPTHTFYFADVISGNSVIGHTSKDRCHHLRSTASSCVYLGMSYLHALLWDPPLLRAPTIYYILTFPSASHIDSVRSFLPVRFSRVESLTKNEFSEFISSSRGNLALALLWNTWFSGLFWPPESFYVVSESWFHGWYVVILQCVGR